MRFILTAAVIAAILVILRYTQGLRKKGSITEKAEKYVKLLFLACYIIAVLVITLGTRSFDNETHIGLNPIRTYQFAIHSIIQGWKAGGWAEALKHLGWYKGQFTSVGLNVLLFVPLGYLVPGVTAQIDRWWKVLLFGFAASLAIEATQLITHLGWFDTSDLLHNSFGALIGYGLYKAILRKND